MGKRKGRETKPGTFVLVLTFASGLSSLLAGCTWLVGTLLWPRARVTDPSRGRRNWRHFSRSGLHRHLTLEPGPHVTR